MIKTNNGYNVSEEVIDFGSQAYTEITYSCMSAPLSYGVEPKEMRIRYCLYKKEVI